MADLKGQDILKPRWDPSLKGRGVRVLAALAAVLVALAAIGWLHLWYFRLLDQPLLMLLAVAGPVLTAGGLLAGAFVVQFSGFIGRMIGRSAFLVFLKAVVLVVLLVWVHALLLAYVEGLIAGQTEAEQDLRTLSGGPLVLEEIQAHLLTADEIAANDAALETGEIVPFPASKGRWAWIAYLLWPLQFQLTRDLIGIGAVVGFVSIVAMFGIWWERKVSARMQSRLGPMRVGGWHGWAQSLADGLKLIQKEDLVMEGVDKPLFKLAPYLAFVPALSAFIALPFGAAWVFRDLDVALIFILAMLGIEVVGVILAGWASNNKWSVYGAMREACQMVSYEIPMGISLLVPIMVAGTLKLSQIGELQAGGFHTWLAFANPFTFVAAVTYFLASLASCKRAPFDLPEAESELVAGFHTEYSGFRWSLFFFAEYAAMFVVCALATILFFGAWHSPLPADWGAGLADGPIWQRAIHGVLFNGPLWFIAKSFFGLYVQIWIRWTLPRIRLDQVMYACVQVLLPLTMVVLLGNTFWGLLVAPGGGLAVVLNVVLTLVGAAVAAGFVAITIYGYSNRRELVGTLGVEALPGS